MKLGSITGNKGNTEELRPAQIMKWLRVMFVIPQEKQYAKVGCIFSILCGPMWNSDQMTIGKMHPTFFLDLVNDYNFKQA